MILIPFWNTLIWPKEYKNMEKSVWVTKPGRVPSACPTSVSQMHCKWPPDPEWALTQLWITVGATAGWGVSGCCPTQSAALRGLWGRGQASTENFGWKQTSVLPQTVRVHECQKRWWAAVRVFSWPLLQKGWAVGSCHGWECFPLRAGPQT